MKLDLSEYIQRTVYLGAYERWETRTFRRYLRPGMSVVDVGANIGYYALLAASLVGSTGRVIAVEPSPLAGDRLEETLRDNGIHNVVLERCGLGAADGEHILYDSLPENHTPTMRGELGAPGRPVRVRTLDGLAAMSELERIDLLKLDVEGYEPEVISGAQRLLAEGRIRAILCEFNQHWLTRGGTTAEVFYRDLLCHDFLDGAGDIHPPRAAVENRFLVCKRAET